MTEGLRAELRMSVRAAKITAKITHEAILLRDSLCLAVLKFSPLELKVYEIGSVVGAAIVSKYDNGENEGVVAKPAEDEVLPTKPD